MRVPKPRVPGVDKVLFAVAGLALGAGALSWWENREPVEVEPEPDVVVGVTLFCRSTAGADVVGYRDWACLTTMDDGQYGAKLSRYYRVTVKSDGFTYEVEYPAIQEIEMGDEWPPKGGPSTPYAVKLPWKPE